MTKKHGLNDDEVAAHQEAFNMYDIDGDGTITLVELKEVMRSLGVNSSEKELMDMIKSVDVDGDHEINFEEFLVLMSRTNKDSHDPDKELRDAFRRIDEDNSGTISRKEIKKLMKRLNQKLTDEEFDTIMNVVDADGNGEIDFEEFKSLMRS